MRRIPSARGSATVEFALAMPAVVLVLVLAMTCTSWALEAARAQGAAAEGARAAITGTEADAVRVARAVAGLGQADPGAVVSRTGEFVTVCVDVAARVPMPAARRCATARDAP